MPPTRCWYCSARRITRADAIGRPSSEKPTAPASRIAAISVSSSPRIPRVTVATKPVGTEASDGGPLAQGEDVGGVVDDRVGVGHRDDPAEAARGSGASAGLDVLLVLLPGRAQVDVGVEEGRERVQAGRVDLLGAVGSLAAAPASAISAIRPSRITRSQTRSSPESESSACAPRITRCAATPLPEPRQSSSAIAAGALTPAPRSAMRASGRSPIRSRAPGPGRGRWPARIS